MTLETLTRDITNRAPFDRDGAHGAYIAVLSWSPTQFDDLTGALANKVRDSARDLYARYMGESPTIATYEIPRFGPDDALGNPVPLAPNVVPDNRALYADEVAYYVTMDVDDRYPWITNAHEQRFHDEPTSNEWPDGARYAPRAFRYVLGYVANDGSAHLSRSIHPGRHPHLSPDDPHVTPRRAEAIRSGLIQAGARSDLYPSQIVYREAGE